MTYFREVTVEKDGSYQGVYRDVSDKDAETLLSQKEIQDRVTFKEVGYAESRTYPYIRILSGNTDTDILKVSLFSGSYPKNSNEILLPAGSVSSDGSNYKLNQVITLEAGIPYKDGNRAELSDIYDFDHPDKNELRDTVERTYTITGFYDSVPSEVNSGNNTTAFTIGDDGDGISDVYFTVHHMNKINEVKENASEQDHVLFHEDLIRFYNLHLSNVASSAEKMIYGFAAVLILLVVIGSVSMIANSFSISVGERMKDYGMLKSIGANRRQIRISVLTEALLCSLYGMIPGILAGFAGLAIVIHLVSDRISMIYNDSSVRMHIVLSWQGLLAAVVICLLTALIAAYRAASKAMRITPIESIRGNKEVNIHYTKHQTGRLTWKLFGLESVLAEKNFQRSRSRFRSIIFSLTISVVLFISASSLSSYLTRIIDNEFQQNPADVTVFINREDGIPDDSVERVSGMYSDLKDLNGIKSGTWNVNESVDDIRVSRNLVTDAYCQYGSGDGCDSDYEQIDSQEIMFLNDDAFKEILKKNHISDISDYFNANNPIGVIYNHEQAREVNDKVTDLSFINKNSFPVTVSVKAHESIDGSMYISSCGDNDEYACYVKNGTDPHNDENIQEVPASYAYEYKDLEIGAAIDDLDIIYSPQVIVIYPASAYNSLKDMGIAGGTYYDGKIQFQTSDHKAASTAISKYLTDHNDTNVDVQDEAENLETTRSVMFTVRVFAIAFILLMSLISITNIFNTIATNMQVRKREFAMLRSVGMTSRGFRRMLADECVTYGVRSLLISLPVSVLVTYIIYSIANIREDMHFYIPAGAVIAAVVSVFIIIILSMLYGYRKLNKEDLVNALRSETA